MIESDKEKFQRMKQLIVVSEKDVSLLFSTPCIYARNMRQLALKKRLKELEVLCDKLMRNSYGIDEAFTVPLRQSPTDIPAGELSKYNGKNGSPAYIAVNGTVYDVTNNAAWAAATHFGLSAGKDLSGAFASCHVDPSVLAKLTVVGKLV